MQINPLEFVIQPNEVNVISIKYTSKEPGIFKAFLNVYVESFYNILNIIEINATSVDFSVYIINE